MFWFFENYGNKYKKVGNCIRLKYVRDFGKRKIRYVRK